MPSKTLKVWLVDDDDYEFFIMDHVARREQKFQLQLCFFVSARAAIATMEVTPREEMPDVILCDIKMPDMDGFEFLAWLRGSRFRCIPCVMRSNSGIQRDVDRAYNLGANSYQVKPATTDGLVARLRTLLDYWCECQLPRPAASCG